MVQQLVWMWCATLSLQTATEVAIEVDVVRPEQHYFKVRMKFPASELTERTFLMPVWTPGSYMVRDYSRFIESFEARDEQGNTLPWSKTDKAAWQVQRANQRVELSYTLFAHEYSVRTNYLDDRLGHLIPAASFFYEAGQKERRHRLTINVPQAWQVISQLPRISPSEFLADNWDLLVDSPFLMGTLRTHEFEVAGIPHYWVMAGTADVAEETVIAALKGFGTELGNLFGSFPFPYYYYLTEFQPGQRRGGLEHAYSTLIQYDGDDLRNAKGWYRFLGLMLHEYFHAWNVKSIRDEILVDVNYQSENYTELLWFHEGFTSYYDLVLLSRLQLQNRKEHLAAWAERIKIYRETPGFRQQNLSDASRNAWIHYYRPSAQRHNTQASYYAEIFALCFDLFLRQKSKNQVGLDDLMRRLYQDFAAQGKAISPTILFQVVRELGGNSAVQFLRKHVYDTKELPLDNLLAAAGLELAEVLQEPKEKERAYQPRVKVGLGARLKHENGQVLLDRIRRDGPAWTAGLDYGDELVAINDRRISSKNVDRILASFFPGEAVSVVVSRRGFLVTRQVTLKAEPLRYSLKLKKERSSEQQAIFSSIFGQVANQTKETGTSPTP